MDRHIRLVNAVDFGSCSSDRVSLHALQSAHWAEEKMDGRVGEGEMLDTAGYSLQDVDKREWDLFKMDPKRRADTADFIEVMKNRKGD